MEILYLYFESQHQFSGQDINFGGQYRFHYDQKGRELLVAENPFYVENFFSLTSQGNHADVVNVSSIIGENGAGKSSLLRLIMRTFAKGFNGVSTRCIIALKTKQGIRIYHSEEIPIDKSNSKDYNISQIQLISKNINMNGESPPTTVSQSIKEFQDVDFIYFSNIFDSNTQIDVEVNGTRNISTNYLVRNDLLKNIENDLVNFETPQNQLDVHQYEDIERQIAFINKYRQASFLPFTLPEYILVNTKKELNFDFGFSRKEKEMLREYGLEESILQLLKNFENLLPQHPNSESIVNYLIATCLINFLSELSTSYRAIKDYIKFDIPKTVFNEQSIVTIASGILDSILNDSKNSKIKLDESHYSWIADVKNFVITLPKLVGERDWQYGNTSWLRLQITGESKKDFERFYNIYRKSYRLKPFLNFTWRSLSSGENALLNIYSRFYKLANEEQINELSGNLIILIDEGDVLLHPSWQKKFTNLLLDYLPRVYSTKADGSKRTIQIILTTNSPLAASDLPNDNTIILEKSHDNNAEDRVIVRDGLNEQKQTFAANIYTLLSDSFFINDGFIGDFASNKIDNIIAELVKGPKPDKKRRQNMRRIIEQIGEPILKHKLMQMYNDRFNLDIHERLDDIENRLGI